MAAWSLLDVADLDASSAAWLPVYVDLMRSRYAMSQRLAQRYLDRYRAVEMPSGEAVTATPAFDTAQAYTSARIAGPITVKALIGRGVEPERALVAVRGPLALRAQKWALNGGRRTVVESARATRGATWRRVSDGSPCAFCAMLVSRSLVHSASYRQPPDFKAHPKCGCTAEEVYGPTEPTEVERAWIDAYDQAAGQARAAGEPVVAPTRRNGRDTVLWRMRRNRPDLFHDGVLAH